jgi:hypothetical protein
MKRSRAARPWMGSFAWATDSACATPPGQPLAEIQLTPSLVVRKFRA